MPKLATIFQKKKDEKIDEPEISSEDSFMSLKDKKVLVYDFGLFTEMAAALKNKENGFGTVWYYVPWQDDFPSPAKQDVGRDFKGIERVQDFWKYVPEADIIVFFDTYCGDIVDYLRNEGYIVWGAGKAEEMELDRWKMRTMQKAAGLPTQQTLQLKSLEDVELFFEGIKNRVKSMTGKESAEMIEEIYSNLKKKYDGFSEKHYFGDKDRLKKEWIDGAKDKIVKGNLRGLFESFMVTEYNTSLTHFNALWDKMAHRANAREVEFIIEEKLEGVEPGTDMIQIDGGNLSPTLWGIEKKGGGMIERILPYEDLPDFVREFNEKLQGMIEDKYSPSSSFVSYEFIFDKDKKPYLIDPSVRTCAPIGGAIFSELYLNLPDIIWWGAQGVKIKPKIIDAKYAAGVNFGSEWAEHHELEITYDKEVEQWLKFRKAYCVGGNTYALSGFSSVCSVIGFGNTPEEAVKLVRERAKMVHATQLDTSTEGLEHILKEEIPKLEKIIGKF